MIRGMVAIILVNTLVVILGIALLVKMFDN